MTAELAALVPLGISALCVLAGLAARSRGQRREREWLLAHGRVVGEHREHGIDSWSPLISFATHTGQEVRGTPLTSSNGNGNSGKRQGRVVDVRYDPADPGRFVARAGWSDRPGLFFFLLAAPFALIGLALICFGLTQPFP